MAKRKRLQPPLSDPGISEPATRLAQPFAPAPIAGIAGTAAATAAATELARTLDDARAGGRMVVDLSLDDVDPAYLVRDRVGVDPAEMAALEASLRVRGQQTPVEVVDLGAGATPRYGLISGWRRLQALKRIAAEDGSEGSVLALLRRPDQSSDAYLAMVEENEIRVGLSYYERARVALKAVEQGAFTDTKAALLSLFHAASRAKRSKIRSFLSVVEALDGTLAHPEDLGERLGLQLAKALEADPSLASRLMTALAAAAPLDAEAEQKLLADHLKPPAARAAKAAKPGRRKLAAGLYCTRHDNGDLRLSGPAVTADLERALADWLADRIGSKD